MDVKWQYVPSRKGTRRSDTQTANHRTDTGVRPSGAAFSQYTQQQQVEEKEAEKALIDSSLPASRIPTVMASCDTAVKKSTTANRKAKQPKKLSVEECMEELQVSEVERLVEDLQGRTDSHLAGLKEIHDYIQTVLSRAVPEKTFTFSSKPPGYPLTAVPVDFRRSLKKAVSRCSRLAQEKAFMYCLDRMLVKLGGRICSYGTRIMILMLIENNSSVCMEGVTMINIYLQSNMSKVPEALSLLWAGLPHPTLHPLMAVRMWPKLCLPLLQQANVPRQVSNYALLYTSLLLSVIDEEGNLVLELFQPKAVCLLLTSQQLLNKRSQRNIKDLLDNIQTAVLESSSDMQLAGYFRAAYQLLASEHNTLLLPFATRCLELSGESWEVWSEICSSSLASASALLNDLIADNGTVSLSSSLEELSGILVELSYKVVPKDRPLIKVLLGKYAGSDVMARAKGKDELQRGRWCSLCGLLVLCLSFGYFLMLTAFFYHISTEGPCHQDKAGRCMDSKWIGGVWKSVAAVLETIFANLLHYLPLP